MRKPLSNMTPHEFVQYQAALGLKSRELAQALNKSTAAVSGYKSGRCSIPMEVATQLAQLVQHESQKLSDLAGRAAATINLGELITFQNTRRKPETHNTEARFMRRQLPVSTKTLPAYRLNQRQWRCYIAALGTWFEHVKGLARLYPTGPRKRDYELELTDIKALAANAPRAIPYDVVIQVNEWDVVSRALRHHSKQDPYAFSMYQTWRRNRGAGSYLNYRAAQIEKKLARAVQAPK